MKSKLFVGLVLVSLACATSERETPKGFKFNVVREGDGILPKPGEYLALNMVYKDNNDSVWMDSKDMDRPWIIAIRDSASMAYEEGIDGIFRMLSKGDSVSFTITTKQFFSETVRQPIPPEIDSTGSLTFLIGVTDLMNQEQVETLQREIMEKQNAEMAKQQEEQLGIDTLAIDSYLKENNIVAKKTESGLRYVITKPGRGANIEPGQLVSVNYAGYLLDGTIFDTSIEAVAREKGVFQEGRPYQPYALTAGIGMGGVITGWEEAILLMNKGAKIRVYIPSTLAYGPRQRSEVIKANSILVFDMELVDVK
ncbi:MAG: FKBP-type peptidyl-prolyl cis-trans isomerase [Cyclobacteriaceae bacterium]